MKSLLLFVPTLLAAGMVQAQTPLALQIKMGLWEETTVTTMVMPGATAPTSSTTKMHVCITPDRLFTPKNCRIANLQSTAKHYSVEMNCNTMSGRMAFDFSTPEAGQGTMHLDFTMGNVKSSGDATMEMNYIGTDCGAVTPDKPEVVK